MGHFALVLNLLKFWPAIFRSIKGLVGGFTYHWNEHWKLCRNIVLDSIYSKYFLSCELSKFAKITVFESFLKNLTFSTFLITVCFDFFYCSFLWRVQKSHFQSCITNGSRDISQKSAICHFFCIFCNFRLQYYKGKWFLAIAVGSIKFLMVEIV